MDEHRKDGDLLVDTPARFTWTELITLAADRDDWRGRVRALNQPKQVDVKINSKASGMRSSSRNTQPTPAPSKTKSKTTNPTNKYPTRDVHEMFFRKRNTDRSSNVATPTATPLFLRILNSLVEDRHAKRTRKSDGTDEQGVSDVGPGSLPATPRHYDTPKARSTQDMYPIVRLPPVPPCGPRR